MSCVITAESELTPGEYYEDCFFHPCLCIRVDDDEVWGISLVDGSFLRGCSIGHCGIRKLSLTEALYWKFFGPKDREIPVKSRWWKESSDIAWLEPFRL
jgi:hypothetical protein